ncbi:MAG: hypothetical protein M3116_01115 [Actinomycetota bacterium]|nr:hypothetical protein [Actinomycetota bacterium]
MSTYADDRGFSLVELIVASMLFILVIGGAGSILLSSLSAERALRGTTSSANTAQLAASSLTRGVRNAHVLSLSQPSAGTYVLRVLIVDDAAEGAATAHCEAWYLGGGEIRTTRSSAAIPLPASPGAVANWTLLADRVTPTAEPMVALDGRTAQVAFQVADDEGQATLIRTTALSRQTDPVSGQAALPAPLEEDSCF